MTWELMESRVSSAGKMECWMTESASAIASAEGRMLGGKDRR